MREDPICRLSFQAAELVARHPPRLEHPNKQIVYRVACPGGSTCGGTMTFSRWAEMRLPAGFLRDAATVVEVRANPYSYGPASGDSGIMEWHVNFADPDLFFGYGGRLFAQDEMQVAEHPALGSLREALLQQRVTLATIESGRPTPVLVTGVERRCSIMLDANPSEGRPDGLYGRQFAEASAETVVKATRPIRPPTTTHLVAMSALTAGSGPYHRHEIECLLATAYSGFRAARLETQRIRRERAGSDAGGSAVVIHTGFWGCGAFGGDRELMAMVQILAARLAGVDRLVFHAFDTTGEPPAKRALAFVERELVAPGAPPGVDDVIRKIEGLGFRWGARDGN